jgi:hypothetical protein
MRGTLIAVATIGLAGCQQAPDATPANTTGVEQPATAASGNEAAAPVPPQAPTASTPSNAVAATAGRLPPPTSLRFVGLWASDVKNCSTAAWRFTDTSISTPAGSHCTFSKVTAVPGGYDIAASCTAEAPAKPDRIKLRFAESAQAMLFESDAIADTGLVYCGREG